MTRVVYVVLVKELNKLLFIFVILLMLLFMLLVIVVGLCGLFLGMSATILFVKFASIFVVLV